MIFNDWCKKWGVPSEAVAELHELLLPEPKSRSGKAGLESGAQDRVRIQFSEREGGVLFRNNRGTAVDGKGNFVRFGLANESAKMGDRLRSADLIGIRPVRITQDMVGKIIGQFVSIEAKRPGWTFKNTKHEQGQANWAHLVIINGGLAYFSTGEE